MTPEEIKHLFCNCENAKALEKSLINAIKTNYPLDLDTFTGEHLYDLLESIEWLTQRERMHICQSFMYSFWTNMVAKNQLLYLTNLELDTIRFCVSKMLEVNKLEHGEICASILTGAYDRTEEFERVLTKLSTLKCVNEPFKSLTTIQSFLAIRSAIVVDYRTRKKIIKISTLK